MYKNRLKSIDLVTPITPLSLSKQIGISALEIQIALAGLGILVTNNEPLELLQALNVLKHLGIRIEEDRVIQAHSQFQRLKKNWIFFSRSIKRRQIKLLYHFTPIENLINIVKIGSLLSRRQLHKKNITYNHNSWGSAEKEALLSPLYICLSFTGQWALLKKKMYELEFPPVILSICPRPIWYKGTCFSPINSASSTIVSCELQSWTELKHFDSLFGAEISNWPIDSQAEVLVKDYIPLQDVVNITFFDKKSSDNFSKFIDGHTLDGLKSKMVISKHLFPSFGM
jgi:hypothetical protein